MIRVLLISSILLFSTNAAAGVTIHFDGQLPNAAAIEKVTSAACSVAKSHSWRCESVSDAKNPALDQITLNSLKEGDSTASPAAANGVIIYPAAMSEPVYLVFSGKNATHNFVKTQFAGADTHIEIIELFDTIKPLFTKLDIQDEGRYWETRNRGFLEEDMKSVAAQIEAIKLSHPNVGGPVKRPDGRILDLVTK